ncbi:MAG: putative CocE/NonD family hydrolase [Saprospiraceae bacterium]|jgi:putative CocE/NonD family hydrolase
MKNQKQTLLTSLFMAAFLFNLNAQVALQSADTEKVIVDQKVMMPMRDGIRLCSDIYRPKTKEKVPVVFVKTPYNFNTWRDGEESKRNHEAAMEYIERGYAYVVQNERGRYFSEGDWDILGPPMTDAYDAFTWLAEQEWCNGKIATIGCSSTAEWQMAFAALDHPAHVAMVPAGYGAGVGKVGPFQEQGNWYRGGAGQMLFTSWLYSVQNDEIRPTFPRDATQDQLIRASRYFDLAPERPKVDWSAGLTHLPIKDIITNQDGPVGIYEEMIPRKPNDPDWYTGGLYHEDMPFGVPSLWIATWFDVSTGPNLALFNHVRENGTDQEVRDNQYVIIAPTLHCRYKRASENTMVGDLNVGDARLDYDSITYEWFNYWLKGNDNGFLKSFPRVHYYTMGANKWQSADTWPPQNVAMETYYLNSGGRGNSLFGDGTLGTKLPGKNDTPDRYTYDPFNPVPSHGGNVCCTGNAVEGGSFDQSQMETRNDILVYTTETLEEGIEVSGFIETTLYVGSDAKDTDFTIKLIDVHPDGKAFNLDETILRARYREGFDKEVFMQKGKVYKLEMSPLSTSNYFAKGHKIRIEIASSNFPRFDRNLNTGGKNYDESEGVQAHNVIYHSDQYPSQVRLPVKNEE